MKMDHRRCVIAMLNQRVQYIKTKNFRVITLVKI